MNSILRSSSFEIDLNGHGGNRRSAQLCELINAAGLAIHDVQSKVTNNRLSRYVNGIKFLAKYRFSISFSYQLIGQCGYYYKIYKNFLESYSGIKLLLWEDTVNYIVPYIAREAGFKIIAVPQNLESLVVDHINPFTYRNLPDNFEDEIKYLSKTDLVFCISREEQWLLRLRGINADFLPYYPPEQILSSLLKLRKARNNSLNKRFLIIGTAANPPTRIGMIEQIDWLKEISKEIQYEVDIAGYGTEQLRKYCDSPNFTLHGTLAPEELNTLLTNAKAVLVHQKAGVGALTRIPEMLIAGIPVIANGNACRSAFNYPGIYCYDSQSELAELMCRQLDEPTILPRPLEAEKRFINCLKQLTQEEYPDGY
ncbi:MAG TPA: hypothetical protein DDZ80_23685 [Cyanobacteria bacterium UBA8803]|nr:hypothetical protein [Cyanobacteria bacterium UBA9273]HBL61323.1 hypothetical protein [Cyanobacteria bacterium UBA8803]